MLGKLFGILRRDSINQSTNTVNLLNLRKGQIRFSLFCYQRFSKINFRTLFGHLFFRPFWAFWPEIRPTGRDPPGQRCQCQVLHEYLGQ